MSPAVRHTVIFAGANLGPELIAFASGTPGTNWGAFDGSKYTKTGGSAGNLEWASLPLITGKTYRVVLNLTRTAGTFTPAFRTGGNVGASLTTSGIHAFDLIAISSNLFQVAGNTASAGSVNALSVRQIN